MNRYLVTVAAIGLFLGGLASPSVSRPASFSCKAGHLSIQESLICKNENLSDLDDRLAILYAAALSASSPSDEVRARQRVWLRDTRSKCNDAECLEGVYWERLADLGRQIEPLIEGLQNPSGSMPRTLKVAVELPAYYGSNYCKLGGGLGYQFSLSLSMNNSEATGTIDGFIDCGRKVWGPIDVKGTVHGNAARVKFETGWSLDQMQTVEALVIVGSKAVFWRILSDVTVENYVPAAEIFQLPPNL